MIGQPQRGIILPYLLVFSWWWWHAFWWFCFFILHHRNISNSIRKSLLHLGEMWDMINDSSRCSKLHSCTHRIYIYIYICIKPNWSQGENTGKPDFPATLWHETPQNYQLKKRSVARQNERKRLRFRKCCHKPCLYFSYRFGTCVRFNRVIFCLK